MALRAIYVGRFQPVHWGHVRVIEWSLERFDELIVVVGSAQDSYSLKNPFTAGERVEMLERVLRWLGIDESRYRIVPVQDIAMNFVWVRYLVMLLPRFDYAVARNPLVTSLFSDYGIRVVTPPFFERERYNATRVRELMLNGGEWERLVPPPVADYIKQINGVERLRRIAEGDYV